MKFPVVLLAVHESIYRSISRPRNRYDPIIIVNAIPDKQLEMKKKRLGHERTSVWKVNTEKSTKSSPKVGGKKVSGPLPSHEIGKKKQTV